MSRALFEEDVFHLLQGELGFGAGCSPSDVMWGSGPYTCPDAPNERDYAKSDSQDRPGLKRPAFNPRVE